MGRPTGEQIENALALKFGEPWNQVAITAMPGREVALEAAGQMLRCRAPISRGMVQQIESRLDPGWKTLSECGIRQE